MRSSSTSLGRIAVSALVATTATSTRCCCSSSTTTTTTTSIPDLQGHIPWLGSPSPAAALHLPQQARPLPSLTVSGGRSLAPAVALLAASGPYTPDTPPAAAEATRASPAAAAADVQQPQESAVWEHVLELLQSAAEQAASTGMEQQLQRQLESTLRTAAKQSAPSAQQLLRLSATAARAAQQLAGQQEQQLPARLVPLLTQAIAAGLPQLSPHQLADMLTALQALQDSCSASAATATASGGSTSDQPAQAATDAATPPASQATRQQRQHAALLSKAVRAHLQQHQASVDASSTAAVAAALAACRQLGSFPILSMLALEHMAGMSPGQVTQLLQAFAAVQHYNRAVCDAAAQHSLATLKRQGFKLHQPDIHLTPQQQKQQQQQQQEQEQQQEPVQGFSADQVVGLVQSFARLRHHDAALLEAASTCLLRSPQRRLEHLVALVHTCAVLNHYHTQLFDAAVEAAEQAMIQQQQQQEQHQEEQEQEQEQAGTSDLPKLLAELSWACGVMGHWGSGYKQQLLLWSGQVDITQLSLQELLLWHEVQTSLTDAALLAPGRSPDGLSNRLVVAAQAAWARRQQGRRLAAFQQEVAEALQQAGVRVKLNMVLDGPVVVDVAVMQRQVGARFRVALQLHPPEDFAANPPHAALGPTAARWRALQARGWRVVTLQQSEWRRLKTKQQQVAYAFQLSQGVEVSGPGMPHVVDQLVVGGRDRKSPKPSLSQKLLRILLEGH